MVDYKLDRDFDLDKNKFNQFIEIDGINQFEQDVVVELHSRMQELYNSDSDVNSIRSKIQLIATRVAREFDVIDEIQNISVRRVADSTGEYRLSVHYYSEEDFSRVF